MNRMRTLGWTLLLLLAVPVLASADPEQKLREAVAGFVAVGAYLGAATVAYAGGLGLILLTVFLAPGITDRGAGQVQASPFRCFLVGLAAWLALVLLLKTAEQAHILAAAVVPLGVLLAVGGCVAVAQDLGRRAFVQAGRTGSRLGRVAAGWGIFIAAALLPFLGWLVLLPVLVVTGSGGFLVALAARPAQVAPPAVADASGPATPA